MGCVECRTDWPNRGIEFETTVALDRNNARAIFQLGSTMLLLGEPQAAVHQSSKRSGSIRTIRTWPAFMGNGECTVGFLGHLDVAVDLSRRAHGKSPAPIFILPRAVVSRRIESHEWARFQLHEG